VEKDRSAEVHCHFDRPTPELIPGMFMNAEIAVTKKQVRAVPNDAIVRWQNHPYIFAVKDSNAFQMLPLETGIVENGYTEIKMEALPEKIVVKNAYSILMKMKNSTEE
jgi:cobalt-zinc-cadmium efflux system membrane fusion protein